MRTRRQHAFTLIETIAVLTAIALLAAALVVPMIRRLDEMARQKEAATLVAFANAYKTQAATIRILPNESGWASAVAAVTGQQINRITSNDRGLPRIFLIDPALRIGTNTSATTYSLSYTQTVVGHTYVSSGSVARPVSPRLIMITSLSKSLPTNIVSGAGLSSSNFTDIWLTADGQIPSTWTWAGRGDDLKIQRIDLSDLFVQVILNNRDATLTPSYSISTNSDSYVSATVTSGCRFPMYFLKGSEIRLYNAQGALEHSEVLSRSQSYTFEYGTWEPESYLATSVGQPSALDLQKAMNLFMGATANPGAKSGASQTTVSNAMVNYITNYIAWRDGSPAYNLANGGKAPAALISAQSTLDSTTKNLITAP